MTNVKAVIESQLPDGWTIAAGPVQDIYWPRIAAAVYHAKFDVLLQIDICDSRVFAVVSFDTTPAHLTDEDVREKTKAAIDSAVSLVDKHKDGSQCGDDARICKMQFAPERVPK